MAQPGGWKQGKIVDMNVKANMDAWRQRLFVSSLVDDR